MPLSQGTDLGWFSKEQECKGGWGQDEVRGQGSKAPRRIGGRRVGGWISLVPQEPHCTG